MTRILIDNYGHMFNTAKEAADFWGIRESSVIKYINGKKRCLHIGRRAKATDVDVDDYLAIVSWDASRLDEGLATAKNYAELDHQQVINYYH